MKLLLDNLAGLGTVDYTAALDHAEALQITRTLNAPSTLKAVLCLEGSALAEPVRRARVVVLNDAGTTLFTGYLTTEPVPVYAGVGTRGPVYRLALHAVSDEWLLDKAGAVRDGGSFDARMGKVACWNAIMDENDYMVRKWNEFIAA